MTSGSYSRATTSAGSSEPSNGTSVCAETNQIASVVVVQDAVVELLAPAEVLVPTRHLAEAVTVRSRSVRVGSGGERAD